MPGDVNFVHLGTGKFTSAGLSGSAELRGAQVTEVHVTRHPSSARGLPRAAVWPTQTSSPVDSHGQSAADPALLVNEPRKPVHDVAGNYGTW